MKSLLILKIPMMVLTLSLATFACGCGPMVKQVRDPGTLPMSAVKLPCVNIDPLPTQVLSKWPEGQGACWQERGQYMQSGIRPASSSSYLAQDIAIKLSPLQAKLQPGEKVLAVLDYTAAALEVSAGPAAQFGVHLGGMTKAPPAVEFPYRWMSEPFEYTPGGNTSGELLLVVRCISGPCKVGRIGWIRAPRQ